MSVTAANGFSATGITSGIKGSGAHDLAVVVAGAGTSAAAVFTTNQAAAAPVIVSREHLAHGPRICAVVLNSGCANAGTGLAGIADARASAAVMASGIGCEIEEVLVCSTGGIGKPLPRGKILTGITKAIQQLDAGSAGGTAAARAIMTTDTVPKESTYAGNGFTIGGMAKGAGMVRPDMATMLVLLTTDAVATPATLDTALRRAVDRSFHSLNIDGCPSTNDAVILLASGKSGSEPSEGELTEAVTSVCWDLANQLAADAEGASRVVTLHVNGARDEQEARDAGRIVADSALVRAAFFGGDPNWGRLLGALGASPITFDVNSFGVAYNQTVVAANGAEVAHNRAALHSSIEKGDFTVTMTIGDGPGEATVITTDLTPEYVAFNAEYS